jgi:hypothetical protein
MFSDQANRARLWTPHDLLLDEADLRADGQAVEGSVQHGVAVKENLAPVRRFDETAILPREEFRDPAMGLRRVRLHLPAHFPGDVFDLPHSSVESISDCDRSILVLGPFAMRLVNDDVAMPGHCDSNIDREKLAVPVSRLRP